MRRVTEAAAHTAPAPRPKRSPRWLLVPLLAFALVALLAGLLAKAFAPSAGGYFELFFSDTIHMKAWLATLAIALAVFQLFTAAWIFHRLPWDKPVWVNPVHRWSGRLVFVDLVDRDEVIVCDRGRGPGLAAEPLARDLVVRQQRVDHLDGDVAL